MKLKNWVIHFIDETNSHTMEDHSMHTGINESKDEKMKELLIMKTKTQFVLPIALLVFILMMWDIGAKLFTSIPNLPLPMSIFNTISMVLASVVLFWIGQPFLQGVVKFINIVLPIWIPSLVLEHLLHIYTVSALCFSL
jgi:cation transport ATPase